MSALPVAANDVVVEVGGASAFVSVNYERRLLRPLLVRAGVGYFAICGDVCNGILTVPFTAELLLGARGSYLDVGGGGVLGVSSEEQGAYATAIVGYRYQRDEAGFVVRAAFTPLWLGKGMVPWVGLAVGHSF